MRSLSLTRFAAFMAVGCGFLFITRQAPPPELATSLAFALPSFVVFILFLASILSWGAWVRVQLKLPFFNGTENGFFDLAVGSVGAYLLSYALTPIGLFSTQMNFVLWAILSLGFALGSKNVNPKSWFEFGSHWFERIIGAIPFLVVVLKLIEGLQFHQHGDAYVTYLPAPRSWATLGNFSEYRDFMQYFLSTSWESLFAWGTALMGLRGGAGMDASQWFAQWCTGGIGVLGIVLGSLALCHRLALSFKVDAKWFPLATTLAVQVPVLRWTANLAKHDMGVSFWGLSAFYFSVYLLPISPALAVVAGVITGAAVIGKLTLGILGVFLGISILIQAPKRFLQFAVGGVLGVLPVLMRNLMVTGSPVFPWFPNLFPTPYQSQSMLSGSSHATGAHFSLADAGGYFSEILSNLPLLLALIAAFALLLIKNRTLLKTFLSVTWVPVLALIGFTVAFRASTEIRYQNATLVLLAAMGGYFSLYLIREFGKSWTEKLNIVFAIVVIATSNITFFTLTQIGSAKFQPISKKLDQIQGTGGSAKLWIRQHLSPKEPIFAVGDSHPYFMMDYRLTESSQSVEFDKLIFGKTPEEAEPLLLHSPFHYLYLASDASFSIYKPTIIAIMKASSKWNQACKLYENPTAQIWDLPCLNPH